MCCQCTNYSEEQASTVKKYQISNCDWPVFQLAEKSLSEAYAHSNSKLRKQKKNFIPISKFITLVVAHFYIVSVENWFSRGFGGEMFENEMGFSRLHAHTGHQHILNILRG